MNKAEEESKASPNVSNLNASNARARYESGIDKGVLDESPKIIISRSSSARYLAADLLSVSLETLHEQHAELESS